MDNTFQSDCWSFDYGANLSFDAWNFFWNVLKDVCPGGRAVVIPSFPDFITHYSVFVVRLRGALWLGDLPDHEVTVSGIFVHFLSV